jgi:ATP-dependent Zn protease
MFDFSWTVPNSNPIKTHQAPEGDRVSVSHAEYLADMDVATGGRAAEELGLCSFRSLKG